MGYDKIIGIDLGTTNSCVAVIEAGKPVVIPSGEGYMTTPSIVSFSDAGERLVGHVAKRQAITNAERTVRSIKRLMGTSEMVQVDHRAYSPEQISALLLQRMKKQAQDYLGQKVTRAIITVPAYFDDAQRLATRDAGEIAGLEVVRIINEPTASALTYGLNKVKRDSTVVVFDFGGGTFDVTILQITEGVLHVKATSGNNNLGGDDFDQAIIDWMLAEFKKDSGIDLSRNATAMQRLKEAAESAKIELSGCQATTIQLPFLYEKDGSPFHFQRTLSVKEFNELTSGLVRATGIPIQMALSDAKLSVDQVEQVILVGGTTRIPAVQEFIRTFFKQEPVRSINPDTAVALGAAIQGGIISGEIQEVLLLDVVPKTISIDVGGGVYQLIHRNTVIPTTRAITLTTSTDQQRSINVHLVQGEEQSAARNKSLAKIDITDLSPAPAGTHKIEATFSIDADGILTCAARDAATGQAKPVLLKRTHGLSREILSSLAQQAAAEAERERAAEARSSAAIKAQASLADAERTLLKYKDSLTAQHEAEIKSAVNALREAVANGEASEMDSVAAHLQQVLDRCLRAAGTQRS